MSRLLLAAVAVAATLTSASAATPFWDGLTAGPYRVGFSERWYVDATRSWKSDDDRAPSGRPVRVSIWYPARDGGSAMHFGDYIHRAGGSALDAKFEAANMRLLTRVIRTPAELQKLLAAPVAAHAGAPAAPGRFPVVVYGSGWNEVWQHANFVLGEYLASRGYVVVTVPQMPPSDVDRSLGLDAPSIDAQLRDLELALAKAEQRNDADRSRVAAIGHSMGGVMATLIAMRHPGVDAVVGLDASYGASRFRDLVRSAADYQPRRFTMPLLDLRRKSDESSAEIIDELRYSDRYLKAFSGVQHADFTSYAQVALHFATDIEGRTPAEASRAYTESLQAIAAFLDKFVARKAADVAFGGDVKRAERRPPDEAEWGRIVEREGAERALARLREHPSDAAAIDEQRLNSIGYGYLGDGSFAAAVGVFRLNAEAHPASANAADSLAEGYLKSGDRAHAAEAYRHVLELTARDATLKPEQKNELERNAREKLRELAAQP